MPADKIVDTEANHRYPCTVCGGMGPHKGNGHLYTTQPQKKPNMYVSSGVDTRSSCRSCGHMAEDHKTGLMFCPTSKG